MRKSGAVREITWGNIFRLILHYCAKLNTSFKNFDKNNVVVNKKKVKLMSRLFFFLVNMNSLH